MSSATPPINLPGMHRSGTTLVTHMPGKVGLVLGWRKKLRAFVCIQMQVSSRNGIALSNDRQEKQLPGQGSVQEMISSTKPVFLQETIPCC